MHFCKEKPSCSTFRVITTNVWESEILGFLRKPFQISIDKFMPTENGERSDEEELVEEVVERPYEIEVEEVREREVMQDIVETRKIPQVRAQYQYRGQGMVVDKGEVGGFMFICWNLWHPSLPLMFGFCLAYLDLDQGSIYNKKRTLYSVCCVFTQSVIVFTFPDTKCCNRP